MRFLCLAGLIYLLLARLTYGQGVSPATVPAGEAPVTVVAPDDPVITVNDFCGEPAPPPGNGCKTVITRAQFEKLCEALQPGMSLSLRLNVANAYARNLRMAAAAEKLGLDKTPAFEEEMRHAFRQRIQRLCLPRIQQRRINRNIKHRAAARRHLRNKAQSRPAGFVCEIRSHPQPREKRRRTQIKSRLPKPLRQSLPLEVNGHEGQSRRNRNARRLQLLALPGLRRGMIHFKHPQPGMRIAISKRVESRAENHVLPHAPRDGASQLVLGIAAARRHERPKRPRKSMGLFRIRSQLFGRFRPNNPQRQRIVEHPGMVQQLMCSPANRHSPRRSAEFALLHGSAPGPLLSPRPRRRALLTRTNFAQKPPRINPEVMIIVPLEADRVFAHGFGGNWLGSRFEHRQGPARQFRWLARLPSSLFALFVAHGARARIAEIDEPVMRNMAVSPFDIHTRAGRKVHLNRLGVGSRTRRLKRGLHRSSIAQDEAPRIVPKALNPVE